MPPVAHDVALATATALEMGEVTFAYGPDLVLDGVSLAVAMGEFVALVGPNGSGKSTLVRIALGLERPASGTVSLLGRTPRDLRQRWRVGYVPQRPAFAGHLPATVAEVVESGRLARRGWARRPRAADAEMVDRALDTVALSDHRRSLVSELSGGQQQRVFIARALASGPDLLILDEPVAGVDAESQARFRDALVACRAGGGAVVLVSHELGAVADDLDRVLLLRRGRLAFDGHPQDLASRGVSLGIHASDLPVWLEGI